MIPNLNLAQGESLIGKAQYNPNTGLYTYGTVQGDTAINVEDKKCVRFMAHYDLMKEGREFVNLLLKEAGFEINGSDPIIMQDHKSDRQVEFYQKVDWTEED